MGVNINSQNDVNSKYVKAVQRYNFFKFINRIKCDAK